jgi:hypothetical protein
MHKSIFPDFRFPAKELPTRVRGEIKPSQAGKILAQTMGNTGNLKGFRMQTAEARPGTCSQTDFLEEKTVQIEKETITEPRMQFLEVTDTESKVHPVICQYGTLKFEVPTQKFLIVEEITVDMQRKKAKIQTESDKTEEIIVEKSKVDMEEAEKARKNEEEMKRKAEEIRKLEAKKRFDAIEAEAQRLELELKTQNEQLNKLSIDLTAESEKNKKDLALRFINKTLENAEYEEFNTEDLRVEKVLKNNQELYERIHKMLMPKVSVENQTDLKTEAKESEIDEIGMNGLNPLIRCNENSSFSNLCFKIQQTSSKKQ